MGEHSTMGCNKTILSTLYFRPHFPVKNPIVPIYKPADMFDSEEMCQTDMQFTFSWHAATLQNRAHFGGMQQPC